MRSNNIKYLLVSLLTLILTSTMMFSQIDRRARRQSLREAGPVPELNAVSPISVSDTLPEPSLIAFPEFGSDSLVIAQDSLSMQRDSAFIADSLMRTDSLTLLSKSSLDRPAFSGAKDSIVEVFSEGKRMVYYYGEVSVEYQDMKLTADYMEYDMNSGTLFARGTLDTLTGEWIGQPKMTQGKDTYEMEELRYNFNSGKARITNMITNDDEGKLHGRDIKMLEDRSINIKHGKYTVCDAEHPHYYLSLSSAKVITKPSQKTVFGPAWPVIEDVTVPIAIPFGFIPKKPERATGMLMPTFGEENARGFYARDAGFYFVFGDYLDLSVTGDYYTLGSWALNVNSRYKVNYKYNGTFGLTYSNDQTGEKGSNDYMQSTNFAVKWSHTQDSKAHPGQSFSASVNFSSPSNSRYNSTSVSEALENQIQSSISFSKNWNGKANLSINALHNQNSRDSSYSFTLPNISFSVSTFYPFKKKVRVGKEKAYEKISFGYNTSFQNKISFKASEFGQEGFLDKFQNGMKHNFSIGLPSFTLAKYINFSPSVSYGMNWFFRKSDYKYNPETDKVEKVDGGQFSTFGITQDYSGGLSMSTRLYGMFNFGSHRRVQAIRHVISPSLSLSVSPEKGTYANGYRTLYYTDVKGQEKEYKYNIYAGQMNSVPSPGRTASASISIGNNLEAKVRDFSDSTGTASKKVKLIDQLNINTSYNFLADSMKMRDIGLSMSTSAFGKVSVSANANFSPYAIDERGRTINKYNFLVDPVHPLRLTNASASLSYSMSGKGTIEGNDGTSGGAANYYQRIYYHPVTGQYIPGGWLYYTNPNVPWSFNLGYSFNYRKSYTYANEQLKVNNAYTQTISMSGNIKLTDKLSITANTGFDLMAMKITTSQISAQYDLHCFNIAVSWVPTGTWKSYSFRIAANASTLSDVLKFKKSSSYWDN